MSVLSENFFFLIDPVILQSKSLSGSLLPVVQAP